MIISEDAYLEHHGVKGMKWGQRKKRETRAGSFSSLSKSDKRKAVAIAGGVSAAAVGAVAVAILLERHGMKPVPSANPFHKTYRTADEALRAVRR
jgi:hypothetical protein